MISQKPLEELSEYQASLTPRIFDLVIGRIFKKIYLGFDEVGRKAMAKIFSGDSDEEKEEFIKKHIPNFKKLFEGEAKKIEAEIKAEIETQA
jgi:hypothetical protein